MNIKNPKNAPKVPFDLDGYILHSEKQIELVHLTLKPGENLADHKNSFDVIFFVIEGEGTLSAEKQQYTLKKGDTTKISSGKNRGWKNTGNQDLLLLVIKML